MRANPHLREKAFLTLHKAGWSDQPIATVLHAATATVRKWRELRGLERNRSASAKIDEEQAFKLYRAGVSDHKIAAQLGVHQTSVLGWRKRRGLPTHYPQCWLTDDEVRKARKMLKLGATRRQVTEALGRTNIMVVQRLRKELRHPGLRKTGITNTHIRQQVLKDPAVQRRIERAIGAKVPKEVRLDAISEMYVDVLEGRCATELIEQQAPSYRNRAYEMCGSRYGARRLDDEIGGGWTIGDTIADSSALEDLEAAADRILSNDNW